MMLPAAHYAPTVLQHYLPPFLHQRIPVLQRTCQSRRRSRTWECKASSTRSGHRSHCMDAATVSAEPSTSEAKPSTNSSLLQFAKIASGEWEGVTATFSARGEPQELPENFVPSAYREWEVKVHDWQTLCSTQVTPESGLQNALKRMMPTVGCEADAVAFTEEAQQGLSQASSGTLPILEDGSYVLAPMQLESGQTRLRLECCLAGDAKGQLAPRTRTRVVHLLRRAQEGQPWQLDAIEVLVYGLRMHVGALVHSERWVAPYNGGAELAGCGGGLPAFATKARLDAAELRAALDGKKQSTQALHLVGNNGGLTEGSMPPGWDRLGEEPIMLPKGLATAVRSESGSKTEVVVLQVSGEAAGRKVRGASITYGDGGLDAVTLDAAAVGK